jgi:ATP-dependent DNA helicase RecG
MTVTSQQLQQWLSAKESEHLEFKEAKQNFHFEKLVKYCAALANEGGGSIVLGVTDKRPRKIVGSQAFAELERTKAGLIEKLHLRIEVSEVLHPDGRVLVFTAPPRPIGMPIAVEGAYWMRAGEDLAPMTPDMLRRIFDEAGPDFSAEVCPGATLADLDPSAIEDLRRRWHQKSQNAAILRMSVKRLLQDAELIAGQDVTYAALILLGTRHALGQYLAQAEVIFEYRSTRAAGPANQREEFRQGFLTFYDRLWELVNLRNDMQHYQDGLVMVNVPTFHERAVREALLNAVSHRDYRHPGSVFVRQYTRYIEVVSPGGFPPGISPNNILDKQNPRNRRIAETLLRCGVVERSGQGADRMFEEMIAHGKSLPDYSRSDRFDVFLTLPGELRHPDLLRFLGRIDSEEVSRFDTHDLLVLRDVALGEKIPAALLPRAAELAERGFLDRSRGGKYILARKYTRKAGSTVAERPRDMAYKKILALLEEHRENGCTMVQLLEVTPKLSRSSVKRVLDDLRQDGKAHTVGATRNARWFPGAAP